MPNSVSSFFSSAPSSPSHRSLEEAAGAAHYTRADLPAIEMATLHPQSTLHMGERLIGAFADTRREAMLAVADRPTGLEGLEVNRQRLPTPDHRSLAAPSTGLSSEQTVAIVEAMTRTLDEYQEEQIDNAPPPIRPALRQQALAVEAMMEGDFPLALHAARGTAAAPMVEHVATYLDGHRPTLYERAHVLLNFYGSVLRNELDSDAGRWAANVHNTLLRNLASVGLTTTLRQLAGMALESHFILEDMDPSSRQFIGAAVMLLGPCLNLLGAIRDESNHTATATSRMSRAAILVLSLGVLGAAATVNPAGSLAPMASLGIQVAIYTTLRDLTQLLFPIANNTGSPHLDSTLMAGLGYTANQTVASLLMDELAPDSGAGYPMAIAGSFTQAADTLLTTLLSEAIANTHSTAATSVVREQIIRAIQALHPHISHDLMRGLINTVAEVGDDLLRPAIARHREVTGLITATRNQAIAEGRDPDEAVNRIPAEQRQGLRIYFELPRLPVVGSGFPTSTQFFDQFLTTSALRTSFFEAIMGATLTAGSVLSELALTPTQRQWALYGVTAAIFSSAYPAFVGGHVTRAAPAPSEADNDEQVDTPGRGAVASIRSTEEQDDVDEMRF